MNFDLKKIIKSVFLCIAFFLVVIFFSKNTFAEYEGITDEERDRIAKSQSAIEKITSERKRIQSTINNIKSLRNDTQKYIEELDKNLEMLTDELNNTLILIDGKQIEIDNTNIVLEDTKNKEAKQYSDMKLRIKFFYEKGETSIFESILTGKNLEDILTKAEYIQSITDYDRKKLNELVDIKNQIIIIENQLPDLLHWDNLQ